VILTGKLMRACIDHGVRIVTHREGEVSEANPSEWLRITNLAMFAEYELRVAKVRARASYDRRKDRGDYIGVAPYGRRVIDGKLQNNPDEDPAVVLEAYDRAGSFLGAAKLLTAAGLPTRYGKSHWKETTVAKIVRRYRNVPPLDLGVRQRASWRFERLLRCPADGRFLTPTNPKATSYFCGIGRRDKDHPRPYAVSERKVLEWAKVEAARLSIPVHADAVSDAVENEGRRAELEAQRESLGWAVADRLLTREQAKTRADAIDAELATLEQSEPQPIPQGIAWDKPASTINEVLRSMWSSIEPGPDMLPVRAVWIRPEWRA
jgi:hypothetical protein